MYKTLEESKKFITSLLDYFPHLPCKVILAPPFTALSVAAEAAKNSQIWIAAQNMSEHTEGAYTGEISAKMVLDAGATHVILGHSERRQLFHETNQVIQKKIARALQERLTPILCIGETESERAEGRSESVIVEQIDQCLANFSTVQLKDLIIAYEPVWAIGTGKTATPEIARQMHAYIRAHLGKKWGDVFAKNISILYGGSVKAENSAALLHMEHVDGALIGGASLDLDQFAKIISLGTTS